MITLAENAGFCFGVDRAVNTVNELVNKGKNVCTLGPIIHNEQLVNELKQKGVRTVNSADEVKDGETLVIRSHGVPQTVKLELEKCGIEYVDATCPFVKKIHSIVKEAAENGDTVFIAGDKNHSEVVGICGYSGENTYVFSTPEELLLILSKLSKSEKNGITAVSQTTFNAEIWQECQKILKKVYTNAKIFDTICNATEMRQKEADELSRKNDVMIVVGGRHSSNTAKLRDVCKLNCARTYLVETSDEVKKIRLRTDDRIGVVAGASTPAHIIKEVIITMSENLQSVEQMEDKETAQKSFEEMTDEEAFEASLSGLTGEQKVTGVVLAVAPNEIQVDIGRGLAGYVTAEEYSNDPNADIMSEVKVGDELNLMIMRVNDMEGTVMLSKRRLDAYAGWDKIVAAKESGEILTGKVKDVIKGGVVVYVYGVRVFIPASQATLSKNEPIEDLKNKEVSFRIIEIGRGRRAIGSVRNVLREQRKAAEEKIWSSIAVGDKFEGTVKSLTSFGAFVDIGGVDGLVHISELSWQRIKNPSEVVLVGDKIEVYVKEIDAEKKKISLGYKKPDENPWVIFGKNYAVGDTVKATIVVITSYGAFARIIPGIDGLIHISQIANKRIGKPQDELTVGQEVEAKIIAVDEEKKRVSLSIRALLPEEAPVEEAPAEEAPVAEAPAEETSAE